MASTTKMLLLSARRGAIAASRSLHQQAVQRSLASLAEVSDSFPNKNAETVSTTKEYVSRILKQSLIRILHWGGQDKGDTMAYSMAFSDDVHVKEAGRYFEGELSPMMTRQLRHTRDQLKFNSDKKEDSHFNAQKEEELTMSDLPKTLEDVMRQKSKAIIVTESTKPFHVVDVNKCWEGLCGYKFQEARGKTIGSLLKGPQTDQVSATQLIAHLLRGEEAGAVLTNYTKDGREFKNRIRVGPIYDENQQITHFVGVLQELY